MIITDKGTIIRTSDNTRNLEYWQSEETNGVVQFEPAYPAIARPGGAATNPNFQSSGGKKSFTLLTNTPLKCTSNSSWLSVKFTESNSDTVSLETLLSNANIERGKLSIFSSDIWTTFSVTFEAEAAAYSVTNGHRSASVRFYTADGSTELLMPPNGNTFFSLVFTQFGPTGGTETRGKLQLTVNGGAGYVQITANFELRTGGSGPQFIYDSKTNSNPTIYNVAAGTYTPYFVNASGYRGTGGMVENIPGRFDKTSVTIPEDGVGNLTLTLG